MTARILVADGDPRARSGLVRALEETYAVSEATTGALALERIRLEDPDVALLDLDMPELGGLEVLSHVAGTRNAPSVVLMSDLADVSTAVAAMRQGAADFLEKPVERAALHGVLQRILTAAGNLKRQRTGPTDHALMVLQAPMIGRSSAIRRVADQVLRVASAPRTTVLITGESGVGKELVARAIHEHSKRREKPFVALNCAALPESLMEAELFGYEPGTFTGSSPKGREGLMAAAEGGTLFLDEIGEMAYGLQAKLLRVLQERSFRRIGATSDRSLDVRVIASTNRDLGLMVERGAFREDLFYRLNVMAITVPPLRERPGDVVLLARHFLEHFSVEFGKSLEAFTPAALAALEMHSWPGNVRELCNAMERAALLAPVVGEGGASAGEIHLEHLGLVVSTPVTPASPMGDLSLRTVERGMIEKALKQVRGNRSAAARLLGVHRSTLYNKLRAYGI